MSTISSINEEATTCELWKSWNES